MMFRRSSIEIVGGYDERMRMAQDYELYLRMTRKHGMKLMVMSESLYRLRISDVFVNEYLVEHRLVEVRLTEQLASGTIVIQNKCVKLTKKGERLASFGRYFRQNWLPKNRLLLGRYSDELTDPFRNSLNQRVYTCD